jgi:hypothetical protein
MESREFAPRRVHVITASVAVMFSFLLLGLAVAVGEPARMILVLLALAVSILLVGRSFRISLVVSDGGVTVKNYWRTYSFPWAAVRRVGIKEGSGVWAVGPSPVVAFYLASRPHPVEAHATRWLGQQEEKRRLVNLVSSVAPGDTVVDVSPSALK